MAGDSSIQWTMKVWNPIAGCSVISPGCTNCYAMKMAARLEAMGVPVYAGLTRKTKAGAVWTGEMRLVEKALTQPLRWRKPTTIFVNSMSDLFHEDVPDAWIDRVFAVMALAPQHTYQILTKRPDRMRRYLLNWPDGAARFHHVAYEAHKLKPGMKHGVPDGFVWELQRRWPLSNVWVGASVEDQVRADERREPMAQVAAAGWITFVSYEPALGPVDWTGWDFLKLLIAGGESGPKARFCWVPNIRQAVVWCARAGVAAFVKQLGADVRDRNDAGFDGCEPDSWPDPDPFDIDHDLDGTRDDYQGAPVRIRLRDRKGGDPTEWPVDLRVRQLPQPITNGAA